MAVDHLTFQFSLESFSFSVFIPVPVELIHIHEIFYISDLQCFFPMIFAKWMPNSSNYSSPSSSSSSLFLSASPMITTNMRSAEVVCTSAES